jgi:hypothetical protein
MELLNVLDLVGVDSRVPGMNYTQQQAMMPMMQQSTSYGPTCASSTSDEHQMAVATPS